MQREILYRLGVDGAYLKRVNDRWKAHSHAHWLGKSSLLFLRDQEQGKDAHATLLANVVLKS